MEEKKAPKPRGGARPGAGRKPDAIPKIYVSVRMTLEERELFQNLGGSAWLREMLRLSRGTGKAAAATSCKNEK